jgi:ABC-type nitrate/sulfonate/bicarbonate transport system substrate-binding protein
MDAIKVAAVSRNYFNMPLWVGLHQGLFVEEGLDVALELHEPIDEVTDRLRDGRVDLALGVTEHVVLDSERGGHLEIIGGNVNKLPFSLIAGKDIKRFADLKGKRIGVSSIEAGSSSLVMQLLAEEGLHYPWDYTLVAVGPILTRWQMLQSGEIDAGLQGVPLDLIAIDQGFTALADPRERFPDFQFTSLNVDVRWARMTGSTPTAQAPPRSRCARPGSKRVTPSAPGTRTPPPRSSRATATPAAQRSRPSSRSAASSAPCLPGRDGMPTTTSTGTI